MAQGTGRRGEKDYQGRELGPTDSRGSRRVRSILPRPRGERRQLRTRRPSLSPKPSSRNIEPFTLAGLDICGLTFAAGRYDAVVTETSALQRPRHRYLDLPTNESSASNWD